MAKKKGSSEDDSLSFRGNRDKWIDFTHEVKKRREKVWTVLERFINQYMKRKK